MQAMRKLLHAIGGLISPLLGVTPNTWSDSKSCVSCHHPCLLLFPPSSLPRLSAVPGGQVPASTPNTCTAVSLPCAAARALYRPSNSTPRRYCASGGTRCQDTGTAKLRSI